MDQRSQHESPQAFELKRYNARLYEEVVSWASEEKVCAQTMRMFGW